MSKSSPKVTLGHFLPISRHDLCHGGTVVQSICVVLFAIQNPRRGSPRIQWHAIQVRRQLMAPFRFRKKDLEEYRPFCILPRPPHALQRPAKMPPLEHTHCVSEARTRPDNWSSPSLATENVGSSNAGSVTSWFTKHSDRFFKIRPCRMKVRLDNNS